MVWLVVVIGALLRFYNLGGDGLDGDEAASWIQAKDSLYQLIIRTAHDNYSAPQSYSLRRHQAVR